MARLLQLAATKKPLIIGAVILSVLASVVSFVPYIAIYWIAREVLRMLPDFSALDSVGIIIGMSAGDYSAFAAKFLFYLLFTPAIASILLKVMYVNGNSMKIINGVP